MNESEEPGRSIQSEVSQLVARHAGARVNRPRAELIRDAVERREALVGRCGCLATWTPVDSTGRSPKDTLIVRRADSESKVDWDSPNNNPVSPETFDMVMEDALAALARRDRLYVTDRVLGADARWALPFRTVTDRALVALFTDNMFRPGCRRPQTATDERRLDGVPSPDSPMSCFADRPFTLVVLPDDKLDPKRYEGRLRTDPRLGHTSTMVIAMDMDRRLGVIVGSAYCGSVKKLAFTVMNYLLPDEGILPLHCSANEGEKGGVALLLGLSGTGKTSLSADPARRLLGDDEHGWSDEGVANFENGCYAKLIGLDPNKEPEIHHACFHESPYLEHGAIVENAMMYPDGSFDLNDERLTPNSRGSYPLSFLSNIKTPPVAGHPGTILFLTADANGVLPPVARLSREQAMFWFLMGYTSKLAGTETGIVEPKSTFSRFFGQPFMPRNPEVYSRMLGEKLDRHRSRVYLVNTGWSGGPYGVGRRMDITLTRRIVEAALDGSLEKGDYVENATFHLSVPRTCPNVDASLLDPRNTWADKDAYDRRAKRLAAEFCASFDSSFGDKGLDRKVAAECPGR